MAATILVEDTLQLSIEHLVRSGQFASTADVVAHGVALIHEQQARVQAFDDAILQGWEDSQGDRIVDLDVGFDAIEAKWRDRIKGLAAQVLKVVLTARAMADLEGIADHIGQDSPQRALDFTMALREKCKELGDMPEAWPVK